MTVGSTYQISFTANFAVFSAGGADWDNWYNRAYIEKTALFSDSYVFSADNTPADLDELIASMFSYTAPLASDYESFQVFARLQMYVNATGAPQTAAFDFENTGTLDFAVANGVEAFSESGVFPNTTPIPEPGSSALATLGITILIGRRRVGMR